MLNIIIHWEKCKSKPRWDITSHSLGWLIFFNSEKHNKKTLKRLAKLEPSYITGGIEKCFEHLGENLVLPENVKQSYHMT